MPRLVAVVCLLSLVSSSAGAASSASAGEASLVLLPPQIVSASQSAEAVPAGGHVQLSVSASDPQGSALTFTWTSSSGLLSAPVSGATRSDITWTAPSCLAQGSVPVRVTVTNAHGLSSQVAFELGVSWDLGVDRQPPFTPAQFTYLRDVTVTPSQTLEYAPPPAALNPERMVFPTDQRLSVSFVYESAGASHALGWMYYDDLVARGYVNPSSDTLVDANANGIADLHEDIYNLAPPSGPQARPYVGTSRRCTTMFTSGGLSYSQPELALGSTCAPTFAGAQFLADARPGQGYNYIQSDVIGAWSTSVPGTGFSDRGLFPRIPNLLEPAAPANGSRGLGRLVFLLSDDDYDRETYKQLGAVTDQDEFLLGVPDYDVSAYDATGLPRTFNPDPGISPYDRSVDLGVVQGGREVVFFLVVHFDSSHGPMDMGTVYPCLRKAPDGRCTLHLKTSTSVFFSKSRWNLDQDPRGTSPVAERNMGCGHDYTCNPDWPDSYNSCTVAGTSQRLCGWLDPEALDRLNTQEHDYLRLPMERLAVAAAGNANMAHLALAVVPGTPLSHWLLGFEDLNGGGDRDFNDVVFRLKASSTGAGVRSAAISDFSPSAAPQCRISRVRFYKEDNYNIECMPQPPSTPLITYAVATDCKVCNGEVCTVNPTPTWHNVPVSGGPSEALLDLSTTPGTQLCWKADLNPPTSRCRMEIFDVDIGYELTPRP